MYINDAILNEFANITHVGTMKAGPGVFVSRTIKGRYTVVLCLKLMNEVIADIKFKAQSCLTVIASLNMLCGDLLGKHFSVLATVSNHTYVERLNITDAEAAKSVMAYESSHDMHQTILQGLHND